MLADTCRLASVSLPAISVPHRNTELYHVTMFFIDPEAHILANHHPHRAGCALMCPPQQSPFSRLFLACQISTKLNSEKSASGFKLLLQLIRYCFTDWVVPSER